MKDSDKNRAVIAEVIVRGWREPAYLSQLRQNPKATLEAAGIAIPAEMDIVLLENTPTIIHAILPPVGDMARYETRLQKAVQMLKDLPEDMEVRLNRDSATRSFIVIPAPPAHPGDLSDAQLEQVVGGKGTTTPKKIVKVLSMGAVSVNNAATATNIATVAEAVTGVAAVEEVAVVTTAAGWAEVVGAVVAVVVPCLIS